MPLKLIPKDAEIDFLTEEDLDLIEEVYKCSGVNVPGEPKRHGRVIFKGPETYERFAKYKHLKREGWKRMIKLGEKAESTPEGQGGAPTMVHRLVERHFVNSLRWPKGIPIGVIVKHYRLHDGSWAAGNSQMDIIPSERQWLATMAQGDVPLTDKQRQDDGNRKDRIRAQGNSADGSAVLEALTKLVPTAAVADADAVKENRLLKARIAALEAGEDARMNAIGAYDDLDMRGLDPAWYERVPRHAQDALKHLGSDLRILWRNESNSWAVVERVPGTVMSFEDGYMRGWGVVIWDWPTPIEDGSGIAANIAAMIRAADFRDDDAVADHVDKLADEARAKRLAQTDIDLENFIESEWPRGVVQETAICRDYERSNVEDGDLADRAEKARSKGRLFLPDETGEFYEVPV